MVSLIETETETVNRFAAVFLVMQLKPSPARDVVRVVCATEDRAQRYVATEGRDGSAFRIVREPILG